MNKIVPFGAILVLGFQSAFGQAPAPTASFTPIPSDDLLGFIENNKPLFGPGFEKQLFSGYKQVFLTTRARTVLPFVFESKPIDIPRTESSVRFFNPECQGPGSKAPTRDDDVKKLLVGLQTTTILALDSFPIAAAVSELLAVGVVAFTKSRQDYGSCALACAMVPGAIDASTISQYGKVTLSHMTPANMRYSGSTTATNPASVVDLGWAAWETPDLYTVTPIPEAQSPIILKAGHPAAKADGGRCPATLVCSRFKNWSDTWMRQAKVTVSLSAGPWLEAGCYDTSVINSEARAEFLQPALTKTDKLPEVLKKYTDALLKPQIPR